MPPDRRLRRRLHCLWLGRRQHRQHRQRGRSSHLLPGEDHRRRPEHPQGPRQQLRHQRIHQGWGRLHHRRRKLRHRRDQVGQAQERRRLDLAGLREQDLIVQNATGAARIALGHWHQYRQIIQKPARERSRAGFLCFIGPRAASGQRRPLYRSSCLCSARRRRGRPDPPATSSEPDLRRRQPRRPAGHRTQAAGADR